jgi:transcriptional regulator with XRE-family HTH domain
MCCVEIDDLGQRLRARRVAAGRTIASVATEAGLSVPYIANLENGRGNPTLTAVNGLATALGLKLRVELSEEAQAADQLPESLVAYARNERFTREAAALARAWRMPEEPARHRTLRAMAALGSLATRPLGELDWQRILDCVVLTTRLP